MPNFYSLTPKTGTEPERLVDIDEKMCAHFGAVPHKTYWYKNWENNIGLLLAIGKSWEEIKEVCRAQNNEFGNEQLAITEWLEANYVADAWAQIGRR